MTPGWKTKAHVAEFYGCSTKSIERNVKKGLFPPPTEVMPGIFRWHSSQLAQPDNKETARSVGDCETTA
jgi:hypothetical protein